MQFVFDPPARPSVAVAGEAARFPVRRIFCVGRNYAAHAREMGSDPDREPPFFFTKPADAVLDAAAGAGARVPYPPQTDNFHHEVELAVALDKGGAAIEAEDALEHVFGYAVAIDLTRRDLQAQAKKQGRPWDMSKGFDLSAPIGEIHRNTAVGNPDRGRIWLSVDGQLRQDADLTELIWPVRDVISILSRSVTLAPGDLVLTGTPAGVGPLTVGQHVRAGIDGLGELELEITAEVV
jgi:fumarylpyruvate hydrolase